MTTKLTIRAATCSRFIGVALVVASAGATWCLATTQSVDISSPAGPLTHVWVGKDLSCQIQHQDDAPDYEFFPKDTVPGDAGTLIAMNGTLYAPDFFAHGKTATDNLGYPTVFMPISQTPMMGSGTAADPFKVITVVDVPDTGLQIQQTDTYVTGREYYTTEVMISNSGADEANGVLYRAADAFLGAGDFGYGFTQLFSGNRKAVGCSDNPNNSTPGKIEQFIPLTGGNNYFQEEYSTVWFTVGSQAPFPDTCACTDLLDNAFGISWTFSIPAGGSATYSHVTTFSPMGTQGLVTTKKADSSTAQAGTKTGYTITIENPNDSVVVVDSITVNSITDTLPAGFVYVPGSTTGATTSNPAIAGQVLTWSGSFPVAPQSSISLHFLVTVASTPGDYVNEAGGTAEGSHKVIATGPTAQITVTARPTATPTATLPPPPEPTATATATPTATATATPAPTSTPPPNSVTCWNYDKYAVFGLNSVNLSSMAGAGALNQYGVIGDVAVGGGNASLLKTTVNGRLFVDSSAHPDIHSDFHVTFASYLNQNLSQDKADVLALSAQIAGLSPTQTFGDILDAKTITSTTALNVISVNSINLTKKNLTLVGNNSGTDVFLINVKSPTAVFILNNSKVLLSGGLTANRVLFNFPGTGGDLTIYKASTVPVMNGTLLAPQRDIVVDNPPILGSIIGSTIDMHSGAKATAIRCP